MSDLVGQIDDLVHSLRWNPYRGYANSGQAAAFQQVRQEFIDFVHVLESRDFIGKSNILQLGMGLSDCSHAVWHLIAGHNAVTIDSRVSMINDNIYDSLDTHSIQSHEFAWQHGLYDVLFIDAGHLYEDVSSDHYDYAPLVRRGGIVAFHDAVHRPQYDSDHHVWRYLEEHHPNINRIGHEVGIAWYEKTESTR